jgi:predicted AAA+ superfamily ATPase
MTKTTLMNGQFSTTIQQKIADGLGAAPPSLTRRDIYLPAIPGKVLAVIGMRRAGKTTFLWQCLVDRLTAGNPRETLLYFNFEDERLAGMQASDLQYLPEGYYRLHPEWRDQRRVTFFLDEIQNVPGWESFVRRLLDSEQIDLFISGSSARLLSREVATSMRGRALEVLVHPFSFRESLRHVGAEPDRGHSALPKAARSALEKGLRDYLQLGGFPEAQSASERDRTSLLRSYVDVALLRDVVERYHVTNLTALRWLLRHLLSSPAAPFSVQKFHDALRSQGIPVGKDTVHAYLGYLEDAFLVRTVNLHTASERQRMVNPRKAYPVDPGLILIYERSGRANLGQALETAVLIELERRGAEIGYVRTAAGHEVDFHAQMPDRSVWLLQVCADAAEPNTFEREVRALVEAATIYPAATPLLLTLDSLPPRVALPAGLYWQPAAAWLLGEDLETKP